MGGGKTSENYRQDLTSKLYKLSYCLQNWMIR